MPSRRRSSPGAPLDFAPQAALQEFVTQAGVIGAFEESRTER